MNITGRLAELWNSEDVLDSLWRISASPYITMLLLIGLTVLVCLGIFLPQRPAEAVTNPIANNLWLTPLRERYHSAADWLVRLRLVDVHRSLWFRGLLGLLSFNLVLGIADAIRPRRLWGAGFAPSTRTLVSALSPTETSELLLERVKEALRRHHYRLVERNDSRLAYANRFMFFPLLVYLGLLFVIGGLALSERTAWWEEGIALRPGQVRLLGHGTDLALRAEVIEASYDPTSGQAYDGCTELIFLRANREVRREILFNHAPSFYAGLIFYQTSTEPVLLIQARDAAGQNLMLQTPETGATQSTEVALRFREEEGSRYIVILNLMSGSQVGRYFQQKGSEKYVLMPSRDLSLRLLYRPSMPGEDGPTFQVEAFRGAETSPFYQQQFHSTESVEIAGDRYTFRPQRYAIIKFGQDYGLAFIFTGATLMLVGIILSAWHPPRLLWVMTRSVDNKVILSFMTRALLGGRAPQWFEDLVQNIAVPLALTVQSAP